MVTKADKEQVVEGVAPSLPAPAFKLVGLDPELKRIHIPLISREFLVAELADNQSTLEQLHSMKWPHVEKV